jgi:hypothetical protein
MLQSIRAAKLTGNTGERLPLSLQRRTRQTKLNHRPPVTVNAP